MTDSTNRPLNVFLCYARSDIDAALRLYQRLTRDGVQAWFDKESLLPGQDWRLEIRRAVEKSDVVIVCLSKNFNTAGFQQREVRLALDTADEKPEGEIFIIPIRLEACDVPVSLSDKYPLEYFEKDGYHNLKRALDARAGQIGAQPPQMKEGATPVKSQRSRTDKPKHEETAQKDVPQTGQASSGSVEIGENVSGSVIVTGNGNVITIVNPESKPPARPDTP